MKNYRVNKNTTTNPKGNNEVHSEDCRHYKSLLYFEDLGKHLICQTAITEAIRRGYIKADGCIECCPTCHSG